MEIYFKTVEELANAYVSVKDSFNNGVQISPTGVAALAILNRRGYSASDIASAHSQAAGAGMKSNGINDLVNAAIVELHLSEGMPIEALAKEYGKVEEKIKEVMKREINPFAMSVYASVCMLNPNALNLLYPAYLTVSSMNGNKGNITESDKAVISAFGIANNAPLVKAVNSYNKMRNAKSQSAKLKGTAIALLSVVAAKKEIAGSDILRVYHAIQNAIPEGYKINQIGTAILVCGYFDMGEVPIEDTIL